MNVQATRLSAVSENIANSNTNGYKQTTTEFTSQILASGKGQYNSGAVEANVSTLISEQGGISYTANSTNSKKVDLAISATASWSSTTAAPRVARPAITSPAPAPSRSSPTVLW